MLKIAKNGLILHKLGSFGFSRIFFASPPPIQKFREKSGHLALTQRTQNLESVTHNLFLCPYDDHFVMQHTERDLGVVWALMLHQCMYYDENIQKIINKQDNKNFRSFFNCKIWMPC